MNSFYHDALQQITKAQCLQDAKVIAWAALAPIPDSLKRPYCEDTWPIFNGVGRASL